MQERVTSENSEFPSVIVQYHPDGGNLGIGLEPNTEVPSKHMIDQIYGNVHTQTRIGQIFRERLLREHNVDVHAGYSKSIAEEDLDNEIGRMILDSVTGSTPDGNGWFTWLSRAGSNRLIRLVRKGRDTSFGRDE